MISLTQQSNWAEAILYGLDDTITPAAKVVNWLQVSLPKLNLSLGLPTGDYFYLSGDYIGPDMSATISGIYEEIYYCDYLRKQATSLLGGITVSDIVEVDGDEQGKIRYVSKNERAKTYRTAYKDCVEGLGNLLNWYEETFSSGGYAYQILYNLRDDPGTYGLKDVCPPATFYRSCNTIWGYYS